MKKSVGGLIAILCLFLAGFLSVVAAAVGGNFKTNNSLSVSASIGYIPGVNSQFKLFDDTTGIFVLKDEGAFDNPGETFSSGVMITPNSGVTDLGQAYSDIYSDWRYEAVSADSAGNWHLTEMLQIHVNSGRKSVTYQLPRAAPAGKYGVRASVYSNGEPVFDSSGRQVLSVFVIMYAEELSYMYCADTDGNMVYNVRENGGLGKTVLVNVFVNPGAVRRGGLESVNTDGFEAGNLNLAGGLGISDLNWQLEDAWGEPFHESRVVPLVEVVDGVFQIKLPENMLSGNYILRVYHDINDEIFGTYVISNGGVYSSPDTSMAEAAPVLLIFGLVFCIGFGVMLMLPRFAVHVDQMQYNSTERKRFKKRTKDILTAEFSGNGVRALTKEEIDKLSDVEKEELFKQRMLNAKQTKSSKFLSRMAENRQKRDYAREAGMSMEEFKEIENRLKAVEGAKEVGFARFRKAVEERSGIITQTQADIEGAQEEKSKIKDMRQRRNSGQPEFELLDSMAGSEVAMEVQEKLGPKANRAGIYASEFETSDNKIEIIQEDIIDSKPEIEPEQKPDAIAEDNAGEKDDVKKETETKGSILARLRRLAGEDN